MTTWKFASSPRPSDLTGAAPHRHGSSTERVLAPDELTRCPADAVGSSQHPRWHRDCKAICRRVADVEPEGMPTNVEKDPDAHQVRIVAPVVDHDIGGDGPAAEGLSAVEEVRGLARDRTVGIWVSTHSGLTAE